MPDVIQDGFELRNVHFTYPGSREEVLKGVSFKLKAGEKMAFVGQNGAGKTTLIKLILRFYEPSQGEILLDGININKFDVDAYRKRFGVIFQDFFKYEFTVRENIAVGDIEKVGNDEIIQDAAARSLADEVIHEMYHGLEQQLETFFRWAGVKWWTMAENCFGQSLYERCRCDGARRTYQCFRCASEYDVFERFIGLTEGKTSIIISHRFSTVRMADRILVLQDGKVLELGTHQELMKNLSYMPNYLNYKPLVISS